MNSAVTTAQSGDLTAAQGKVLDGYIAEGHKHLEAVAKSVLAFARLYKKACQLHPVAKQAFEGDFPKVSRYAWSRLLKAAEGTLHGDLVFDGTVGAKALERCPLLVQAKYVEEPIPFLTVDGHTDPVYHHQLTRAHTRQIFSRNGVRSISEQGVWQEAERTRAEQLQQRDADNDDAYVCKDKLHVLPREEVLTITRKQLLEYLAEME